MKQRSLSEPIAPYVQHRLGQVRQAAVNALIATGGEAAVAALRDGLRSQDAAVRGLSASGLGALGDPAAVPDLFLALDHNVGEAATSIGQLCDDASCLELAQRLGRAQFDVITSGLEQVLFRSDERVKPATKVKVVQRIGGLETKEAAEFLLSLKERLPKSTDAAVMKALTDAIVNIRGR